MTRILILITIYCYLNVHVQARCFNNCDSPCKSCSRCEDNCCDCQEEPVSVIQSEPVVVENSKGANLDFNANLTITNTINNENIIHNPVSVNTSLINNIQIIPVHRNSSSVTPYYPIPYSYPVHVPGNLLLLFIYIFWGFK